MKKKIILALMTCATAFMMSCGGDHSDRTVRDTAKNTHNDVPSNIDTSKTTTATGDASNIDNSASGGTKIAKDTSKTDTAKKH